MNPHQLQEDEARYLLFAVKKVLRESEILPPRQVQFYESLSRSLREKLERIDRAGEGYPEPPTRDRFAKVRPTWRDITLGTVENYPQSDT